MDVTRVPAFVFVHMVLAPPLPGAKILRYCGRLNIHFIRESFAVRQAGGFVAFMHTLYAEANAVARAHALALGGNGLLG